MRARLALCLALAGAGSAAAWTLDQTIAKGLETGRTPRRLASRLKVARHVLGRTGADFRPVFDAAWSERGRKSLTASQRLADETRVSLRFDDPAEDAAAKSVSLDLFVPVFRTQALVQRTAEVNWQSTRRRIHQQREDYKLALVRGFYSLKRSQSFAAIRAEAVERWDTNLASARFRSEIGVKSKLDFWNTKVNQANAVVDHINAVQAVQAAKDSLGNQLGIDFDQVEEAEVTLKFEVFDATPPARWSRADLEALDFERRLARAALDAARRAAKPDLSLNLGLDRAEGRAEDASATLNYSFQIGRRREWHDARVAQQSLIQAEIAYEQLAADIQQEQRQVLRDLEATRQSLEVAKESLELAELSYEASRIQFEGGRINQIEFQNAQDKLTQAQRSYESLLIDYEIAGYRWKRAYGVELFP